jgi:CBS domain-containing protein
MPDTTLVRDVMTPKVMTLRADQAIGDAADEMATHKYGAMPVVDDAGKLLGLLRDEDFIVSEARVHVPTYISLLGVSVQLPSHVDEELRKVAGSTVGEVMEEHPLTVAPDDTLEDLATAMHETEESHVPVIDANGVLVGIVARGDIVRFIARTT